MNKTIDDYLDYVKEHLATGKEHLDFSEREVLNILFKWGSDEARTLNMTEKTVLLKQVLESKNCTMQSLYMSYLEPFLEDHSKFREEERYFYKSIAEYLDVALSKDYFDE